MLNRQRGVGDAADHGRLVPDHIIAEALAVARGDGSRCRGGGNIREAGARRHAEPGRRDSPLAIMCHGAGSIESMAAI
jgi:hypothetical protein